MEKLKKYIKKVRIKKMEKGIFEIAAELGKAIREDARYQKFEAAKLAYDACDELQKNMVEYEVQQTALRNEYAKEEKDMVFIEAIQKRIDELYKSVTEAPEFIALNESQNEINELMNSVNTTITYNITGEMPSSCTHDCSTCGGCH